VTGRSARLETNSQRLRLQKPEFMYFAQMPNGRFTLFRVMALSCTITALFLVCESSLARATQKPGASVPGWVMNIPLWKVLPTKQFAILGEGVVKSRRWAIFAFANDRSKANTHPCIENVTLRYEHRSVSISNGAPSCGALAPPNPVPVTTEYAFTNVGGVVVGMTLDPSVARVRMDFSAGPDLDVPTKLLNSRQAKKARLKPFQYVAMGVGRKACLEAFEGIAESGDTLFQTALQECVL
jgi:hypothetical protein